MKLPRHISCSIEHNECANYYKTVKAELEMLDYLGSTPDFTSDAERQECIDRNELWVFQWYPDTPIGSCAIAAPTLERLIELIEIEAEKDPQSTLPATGRSS